MKCRREFGICSGYDIIKEDFNKYMGPIFEDISTELLQSKSPGGGLPLFTKWGKWWHKEEEIDIVALNENTRDILFCECKWQNKKMDISVIKDLIQKSEHVEWKNQERINHYAVVSKTGFTADAKRFAEKNGVHTFTLSEWFETKEILYICNVKYS